MVLAASAVEGTTLPASLPALACRQGLPRAVATARPVAAGRPPFRPAQTTVPSVRGLHLGSAAVIGALPAAVCWVRRAGRRACRHLRNSTALRASGGREPAVGVNAGAASLTSDAGQEVQDNALEEWLLAQDLPQPLRPILGSSAWANLTAALAQFGLVAGLGSLGTFLEQGGPADFYARQYPALSGIILTFGLDHVYTSPLFLGLLIWLTASIAACTATTQLPLAKRAQRFQLRSAKSMRRLGSFLVRVDCGPQERSEAVPEAPTRQPEPERARAKLRGLQEALCRRGFAVRVDDEACPSRLAASRGLVGKFAPMVVHLALLLCLAGGAAGILFGASSEVMVKDGGTADLGRVLDVGRRAKGPLYDMLNPVRGLLQGTLVRCEDFRIKYRDDGEIDQFYSKLVLEDAKTKDRLFNDEIYVNKPLRYGGATVYQADWSLDRLQLYLNGQQIVVPLKALPDETGARAWGAFLPEEFVTAKDPSSVKRISKPNEGIVLVVENMRNVQVYGSNKELVGVLRSPDARVDKKIQGMPIQFGEAITVEGGSELRLDRIVGATGLIVKNDPGVPLVYLGFALLMPATLLSVLPYGQVWGAVGEGEEAEQLLIAGKANRNQPSFEDEMKAMIVSGAL